VDLRRAGQAVASHIDEHHPRLGSRLMQLRWGGLRTLEPGPGVFGAVATAGLASGVALHRVAGRRGDGRARIPAPRAAGAGVAAAWLALWRWDAARWRRTHVRVALECTSDELERLVDTLGADGVQVQRWDRSRSAGGRRHGVSCRLRDLRRVNAAIDDLHGRAPAPGGPAGRIGSTAG
jgi:hypothetical protein